MPPHPCAFPRPSVFLSCQAYFGPPSLATLAWAFSALDLHDEELFLAIAKKVSRRIRFFTPHQMSQVCDLTDMSVCDIV